MRMLVVGGSGYLGGEVVRQAAGAGHEVAATYGRARGNAPAAAWRAVDLREAEAIHAAVRELRPQAVVNCAYRKDDWSVTADGAARVAVAAAEAGAQLVHVSTDLVFAGGEGPVFAEDALPAPDSVYGAAKAAAETAVLAVHPDAAVVRTSLILGDGRSVPEGMVRDMATGRRDGLLFTDVVRCPVHVADLATALLEAAAEGLSGTLHAAGADALSRAELGRLIAEREGLSAASLPIGPAPAGPSDIRLDCTRTRQLLNTRLRGARAFLADGGFTP